MSKTVKNQSQEVRNIFQSYFSIRYQVTNERWRGSHGNRVDAKLTVVAQVVKAESTIYVGHCVIPLCLIRSDGTVNRGLFWLHMHSIWHGSKRSWHCDTSPTPNPLATELDKNKNVD